MNHRSQLVPRIAQPFFLGAVLSFFAIPDSVCAAQDQQNQPPQKKEEPASTTAPASPATASSDPAAQEPPKPLTLKEAIRQKKVLTEDDLHSQFRRKSREVTDTREFNPICNPQCEQMVRDQMQTDDSSELEFRNKFALATQQIDDDHKWGNDVVAAVHAADDYCDLERNRATYANPGATPPYTTDKLNFDFVNKEREVWDKYTLAKGNIEVRIRNMRTTDPFRAIVMQSQWDVALQRSCRGVDRL